MYELSVEIFHFHFQDALKREVVCTNVSEKHAPKFRHLSIKADGVIFQKTVPTQEHKISLSLKLHQMLAELIRSSALRRRTRVELMRRMPNTYTVVGEISAGKRTPGRPKCRWKDRVYYEHES
jgi:hypothetical protein